MFTENPALFSDSASFHLMRVEAVLDSALHGTGKCNGGHASDILSQRVLKCAKLFRG